jgi:pantetheine-phosphate adenylyltransferase
MTKRLAVFAGSFDPMTHGHLSILNRGLRLFDEILVAVTINVRKKPLFTAEERMSFVRTCFPEEPRIRVECLDGLLAQYASDHGACALLRGLRAPSDFEYELQMSQMNRFLCPELETVFLSAEAEGSYVSSSLVKEVAALGGDVGALVPPHVHRALVARYNA